MDIGRVGLLDVLGIDGGVGWDLFSNTCSQATAVRIKVWKLEPIHGPVLKSWQASFISNDVRTLAPSFPTFTKQ
jgi:hypothetical protein